MLPALEQRLVDVALVELGIADERHEPPLRPRLRPGFRREIVLRKAGEDGEGGAEADRAGRDIDVVLVLGPRGVGLRAAEAAEALELVAALAAEEILDGMEHRARMRLDRDPVLGAQHGEIERGHDGDERGGGGLVAADLEPILVRAEVVRVMDHPAREPEQLALELRERGEIGGALAAAGLRLGLDRAYRHATPSGPAPPRFHPRG